MGAKADTPGSVPAHRQGAGGSGRKPHDTCRRGGGPQSRCRTGSQAARGTRGPSRTHRVGSAGRAQQGSHRTPRHARPTSQVDSRQTGAVSRHGAERPRGPARSVRRERRPTGREGTMAGRTAASKEGTGAPGHRLRPRPAAAPPPTRQRRCGGRGHGAGAVTAKGTCLHRTPGAGELAPCALGTRQRREGPRHPESARHRPDLAHEAPRFCCYCCTVLVCRQSLETNDIILRGTF